MKNLRSDILALSNEGLYFFIIGKNMSMLYHERMIAREIAYMLPMFSDHSRSYIKVNFRCPICGDSLKDKYKARGWFYESKGNVRFGCFNCGRNMTLYDYLKNYDDERYREYLKEKYRDRRTEIVIEQKVEKKEKKSVDDLPYCVRMDNLDERHPAAQWMLNRKIPKDKFSLFFFTSEWKQLTNHLKPETYRVIEPEYRLVIPIYNPDMSISTIQGRALGNVDKNQRYLTVKKDDDASKVYGTERIDDSKTVFFHEGPIDSIFIPNSVAIVGGSMTLTEAPYSKNRVWVMDNEPRSPETIKRIETLVNAREKVVLWDRCRFKSKDINDMIKNEGASAEEIEKYLHENIVQGLTAKNRLISWRRFKK